MPLALWPFSLWFQSLVIWLSLSSLIYLMYVCCELQAPWLADTVLVMGIQEGEKT